MSLLALRRLVTPMSPLGLRPLVTPMLLLVRRPLVTRILASFTVQGKRKTDDLPQRELFPSVQS